MNIKSTIYLCGRSHFSVCMTNLGNLWIMQHYPVAGGYTGWFLGLCRKIAAKCSRSYSFFCSYSWKRADFPYIRLWKVFLRRWPERINWHKWTWHTDGSRSSSTHDIPFSCTQTDTWWSGMRALLYRKFAVFHAAFPVDGVVANLKSPYIRAFQRKNNLNQSFPNKATRKKSGSSPLSSRISVILPYPRYRIAPRVQNRPRKRA